MDPKSLTDAIIQELLSIPKIIRSKRQRETPKAKHIEKNLEVHSLNGEYVFTLLTRQSTLIPNSFSCGLIWQASSQQRVMLTRYNGSDHEHSNPIEGDIFGFSCHIHVATERYIASGRKVEHFAIATDRYTNLEAAVQCMMQDCNISKGTPEPPDEDPTYTQWGLF